MITIEYADDTHLNWLIENDDADPDWTKRCIDHQEYIIAQTDTAPIGFLRYSLFWGKIPYMDMIRVAPDHQRTGIGRGMLNFWDHEMRKMGFEILMTSSEKDEQEPQDWHKQNGFVESGALTFGHLQTTPEIFFVKALD